MRSGRVLNDSCKSCPAKRLMPIGRLNRNALSTFHRGILTGGLVAVYFAVAATGAFAQPAISLDYTVGTEPGGAAEVADR